ncbi:MAG: hypothetical protein HZB38_14920 [Planctomycetes bacterium]|nr:hypothetical protein [Planctomycetota bacterium]
MEWPISSAALWASALAVVPVALVCGCICRILPLAPASKHGLWLATLLAFILPLILPNAPSLPTSTMLVVRPAASPSETPASAADLLESSRTVDQSLDKVTSPSGVASSTIESPVAIKPAPTPRAAQPAIRSDDAAGDAESTVLCAGAGSEDESENNEAWAVASWTSATKYPADQPTAIEVVPQATASSAKPRTLSTERRSNVWRNTREAAGEWLVIWSIVLNDVRAWIARLPGLPLPVWLCGIAALLAVQMARFAIFARRLRGAVPAPTIVQRSVSEVCAALGLSRTPRTLLVDQRVSPMIVPGLRPRLVLPMRLWAQLDKHGRRAILCHELAHLRRRDHWVCWIASRATPG